MVVVVVPRLPCNLGGNVKTMSLLILAIILMLLKLRIESVLSSRLINDLGMSVLEAMFMALVFRI